MTLIEVMVSMAVLVMIAVLVHGVLDSLSRGKKAEAMRADRVHAGREAIQRIVRDLSAAYLSMHVNGNPALITGKTAFVGKNSSPYDRLDFTAFAHLRTDRDSHESDQAEVGYFAKKEADGDKMDLVRREQTPIDIEPTKGGPIDVLAEDIVSFDVRYFDPKTGMWNETWDSTQVTGQPMRLPLEVEVTLVLKGVGEGADYPFTTKLFLPMQDPLTFGIQQ
jgi:general secretion pathway protein J